MLLYANIKPMHVDHVMNWHLWCMRYLVAYYGYIKFCSSSFEREDATAQWKWYLDLFTFVVPVTMILCAMNEPGFGNDKEPPIEAKGLAPEVKTMRQSVWRISGEDTALFFQAVSRSVESHGILLQRSHRYGWLCHLQDKQHIWRINILLKNLQAILQSYKCGFYSNFWLRFSIIFRC